MTGPEGRPDPELASRQPPSGWGTNWRQRVRLAPLYWALVTADRLARLARPRAPRAPAAWREGVSVVIPERDAPAMLAEALASVTRALAAVREPHQVIVVANGTPRAAYAELERQFPTVELVHSEAPLGFVAAIERGVARARHGGTYLMNNDVVVEPDALAELLPVRGPGVFAIASQIFQRSANGRREETGFTDWYLDAAGVQLHHAPVPAADAVRAHLCASGGAALFCTDVLRRYLPASRCYHPFYWEDAEWGLRAWRDGLAVLYAPRSHAAHRHRASTARFYTDAELERIVQRNRLLFDLRHGVSANGIDWLMTRLCDLPYATQRELARPAVAAGVLRRRVASRRAPQPLPPPSLVGAPGEAASIRRSAYSFRLTADAADRAPRPRLLLVTPFAVFPPRHGGARRVAELARALRSAFNVVLVTDEAHLYDARSLPHFDGLHAIHLVQRERDRSPAGRATLAERMRTHCHARLVAALERALDEHRPAVVQVEHLELAGLVAAKRAGQRWILDLHDAYAPGDFADAAAAERFERDVLAAFDAVTVCSEEDRALVHHPRAVAIANGSSVPLAGYRPSQGMQLLFMGPFRYPPNLAGIAAFAREAFPAIRAAHPAARLLVLGGDGAPEIARRHPGLAAAGIEIAGHRDDVAAALSDSALGVNPLAGIRGSAVKLIETLTAGRVCVSTADAARGFAAAGFTGLVTVPDVAAMAAPIIELLGDDARRHRLEAPQPARLAPYQWAACLAPHVALCAELARPDAPEPAR